MLVSLLGTGAALSFSLAFRRAWRPSATPEVQELANQTDRRLGAIYARILALAFNAVMSEHTEPEEAEADSRKIVNDLAVYVGGSRSALAV